MVTILDSLVHRRTLSTMAPSYTAVVLAAALLPISNALLTVGPPALARRPAFEARRTVVKSSIDEPSRRDVLTTLARGLAASVAAPLVAVAAEEGVPSASYEGYGGMALGAGTMASKTRPESGVVVSRARRHLRRDPRNSAWQNTHTTLGHPSRPSTAVARRAVTWRRRDHFRGARDQGRQGRGSKGIVFISSRAHQAEL